jgi:hypothetical protein
LDAVFNDLETVFYENNIPSTDSNEDDTPLLSCRFKTKVSELKILTMYNFIRRNCAEEMEEGSPSNFNVDAGGSWKSILAWGKGPIWIRNSKQHSKFLPTASMEHFESDEERLRQLALQKPEQETPLRLFVTGPGNVFVTHTHRNMYMPSLICTNGTNVPANPTCLHAASEGAFLWGME